MDKESNRPAQPFVGESVSDSRPPSPGPAQTPPVGAVSPHFVSPSPQGGDASAAPASAGGPPSAGGGYPQLPSAPRLSYPAPNVPGGLPSHPPVRPYPGPAVPAPTPQQPRRSGPGWLAVTAIAVACSLAAAFGTAAVAGVFNEEQAGPTPQTATTTAPIGLAAGAPDWQRVAQAVGPSVVAIELRVGDSGSSGSGVITDAEGHIITNHHVIAGGDQGTLDVILSDGRILPAELVGSDPSTDLAVIKIKNPPADLTAAEFGTVDTLRVGQPVAAIGNPLGLAATMTTGIISALNRPVTTEQEVPAQNTGYAADRYSFTNAIQVDASINPGNSGGPLFDASGKVIGINSSIATIGMRGEGGSIGLGFAIPIDVVVLITEQIKITGTAEHAFLGVDMTDASVTVDGAGYLGVEVRKVTSGSAAESAGLRPGDIILAIDDTPTLGMTSLIAEIRGLGIGQEVEIKFVRDGKIQTASATLTSRPLN
ncbi:PDZ domain-containing protein [Buchananella hordeovulneris]|uniref:S1C family serine protease n=1 Tax=Buchananella hordeovulneris TaxID=52770 RepID=UPI000F5F444B|nr:trypsin-like peptidase domain-containing protein [Buchananella hordeovulneris]RRD51953.1 PDZ domain-containing protein [Buchananella hordeovulneris]